MPNRSINITVTALSRLSSGAIMVNARSTIPLRVFSRRAANKPTWKGSFKELLTSPTRSRDTSLNHREIDARRCTAARGEKRNKELSHPFFSSPQRSLRRVYVTRGPRIARTGDLKRNRKKLLHRKSREPETIRERGAVSRKNAKRHVYCDPCISVIYVTWSRRC